MLVLKKAGSCYMGCGKNLFAVEYVREIDGFVFSQ